MIFDLFIWHKISSDYNMENKPYRYIIEYMHNSNVNQTVKQLEIMSQVYGSTKENATMSFYQIPHS